MKRFILQFFFCMGVVCCFTCSLALAQDQTESCSIADCVLGKCDRPDVNRIGGLAAGIDAAKFTIQPNKDSQDGRHAYGGVDFSTTGVRHTPLLFSPIVETFEDDLEGSGSNSKKAVGVGYPQLGAVSQTFRPHTDRRGGTSQNTYGTYRNPSLQLSNLSVDKEIFKSALMTFSSPGKIAEELSEDKAIVDQYLDSYTKLRHIAHLTLKFADSGVSQGMKDSIDMQMQDATMEYLRRIDMRMEKLANPEQEKIYNDHDEKFAACLVTKGDHTKLQEERFINLRHVNIQDCEDRCGERFPAGDREKLIYHYCSCCAVRSMLVNSSTTRVAEQMADGQGYTPNGELQGEPKDRPYTSRLCYDYLRRAKISQGENEDGIESLVEDSGYSTDFSLVERAFIGLTYDHELNPNDASDREGGHAANELRTLTSERSSASGGGRDWDSLEVVMEPVNNFTHFFQDIYGDYCTYTRSHSFDDQNEDNPGPQSIVSTYALPYWSVEAQIDILRNGMVDKNCFRPFIACPSTGSQVSVGICPAFRKLLALQSGDGGSIENSNDSPSTSLEEETQDGQHLDLWVNASMGGLVTIKDINNVLDMAVGGSPEQERWIENFCDAAAVEAFKRLHLRMATLAENHLTMNLNITDRERAVLKGLVARVTGTLSRALADISNGTVRGFLIAAEQGAQSDLAQNVAGLVSAQHNRIDNAQSQAGKSPFGGAGPHS